MKRLVIDIAAVVIGMAGMIAWGIYLAYLFRV
jgi:hypothetical protein